MSAPAVNVRAWLKKARREFRVLGLPLLRPVQIGTVLDRAQLPWLRAERCAEQALEALTKHVHTCARPDPETLRLLAEYTQARCAAEIHESGIRTLMGLELDYLRPACWGDAWRDQVIPDA